MVQAAKMRVISYPQLRSSLVTLIVALTMGISTSSTHGTGLRGLYQSPHDVVTSLGAVPDGSLTFETAVLAFVGLRPKVILSLEQRFLESTQSYLVTSEEFMHIFHGFEHPEALFALLAEDGVVDMIEVLGPASLTSAGCCNRVALTIETCGMHDSTAPLSISRIIAGVNKWCKGLQMPSRALLNELVELMPYPRCFANDPVAAAWIRRLAQPLLAPIDTFRRYTIKLPRFLDGATMTQVNDRVALLYGGSSDPRLVYFMRSGEEDEILYAPPPPSRNFHAACTLNEEQVFIFGGLATSREWRWLNDCWLFCLFQKKWIRVEAEGVPPCPRARAIAVHVGPDLICVYGGSNGSKKFSDVHMLRLSQPPRWERVDRAGDVSPPPGFHVLCQASTKPRQLLLFGAVIYTLNVLESSGGLVVIWNQRENQDNAAIAAEASVSLFRASRHLFVTHNELWELTDDTTWRRLRNDLPETTRFLLCNGNKAYIVADQQQGLLEFDLCAPSGTRRKEQFSNEPIPMPCADASTQMATTRIVAKLDWVLGHSCCGLRYAEGTENTIVYAAGAYVVEAKTRIQEQVGVLESEEQDMDDNEGPQDTEGTTVEMPRVQFRPLSDYQAAECLSRNQALTSRLVVETIGQTCTQLCAEVTCLSATAAGDASGMVHLSDRRRIKTFGGRVRAVQVGSRYILVVTDDTIGVYCAKFGKLRHSWVREDCFRRRHAAAAWVAADELFVADEYIFENGVRYPLQTEGVLVIASLDRPGWFALGCDDGMCAIYHRRDRHLYFIAHDEAAVSSIVVSRRGTLATGSTDGVVRVWSVTTPADTNMKPPTSGNWMRRESQPLEHSDTAVTCLCLVTLQKVPNHRTIVSLSLSCSVEAKRRVLAATDDGSAFEHTNGKWNTVLSSPGVAIDVHPNNVEFATVGLGFVRFWEFERCSQGPSVSLDLVDHGTAVAYAPTGRKLAVGTTSGRVLIVSRFGHLGSDVVARGDTVTALCWAPHSRYLAVGTTANIAVYARVGVTQWKLLASTYARNSVIAIDWALDASKLRVTVPGVGKAYQWALAFTDRDEEESTGSCELVDNQDDVSEWATTACGPECLQAHVDHTVTGGLAIAAHHPEDIVVCDTLHDTNTDQQCAVAHRFTKTLGVKFVHRENCPGRQLRLCTLASARGIIALWRLCDER